MRQLDWMPMACVRVALAVLLFGGVSLAGAQSWTVQTLTPRVLPGGGSAKLAIATPAPESALAGRPSIRHVLVYPQPLGVAQLKVASGTTTLNAGGVWMRALPQLQAQGISLVYVDAPSDAERRNIEARPSRELRQDLAAVAKEAKQLFPDAQIHLAGFGLVAPLLDIAGDLDGFKKIVLSGSAVGNHRATNWSSVHAPVLMLHAPGAQCDSAPFLEARAVSERNRFTLVQVGYERQDQTPGCGRTNQHLLSGKEEAVAKAVADWLDGKELPQVIGYADAQIAWREEIINYQAPAAFGSNQLEATLLLPEARSFGAGPYPVMVWNHGDIQRDSAAMRYKSRIRDMVIAREFLQLGVAVLMPARRGVGMSEGTYPTGFSAGDADATYKARVHAEDILPALAWLKTRKELDAGRVILSGQSAGGYTTMYIASQNPAGLIGAIDFSGGRTNMTGASNPTDLNQMMVNGFAEFGKTTRPSTLWVFAENDSRYTPNTIRASYDAFQKAGGKGRLLLSPSIEGDGHFIHHKPDYWRLGLQEYLSEIGAVTHVK
jgi:dienelactone hydrolase